MKKIIIGFFIGIFFAGSLFQFDIGFPNLSKKKIQKVSNQVANQKTKLKKGIAKRAVSRAGTAAARTAIPIPVVTTGIAATMAVVITAHEYCEAMQTLENISRTLEDKELENWSIESCSEEVYEQVKTTAKDSGDSASQWIDDSYDKSIDWISNKWDSVSNNGTK